MYLICGLGQDLPSSQNDLFQADCLLFMLTTNKLAAFNSDSETEEPTEEPTEPLCPVRALKTSPELAANLWVSENLFIFLWDGAHKRGTSL